MKKSVLDLAEYHTKLAEERCPAKNHMLSPRYGEDSDLIDACLTCELYEACRKEE